MTPCRIFPAETIFLNGTPGEMQMGEFMRAHQNSINHLERSRVTDEISKVYVIFNNRKTLDAFGKTFSCSGFSAGSKRLG